MKIIITGDLHYGFSQHTHNILETFYDDVVKKDPDVFIIAGDIISHDQSQWDNALQQMRRKLECEILVVLGNHDLWQTGKKQSLWEVKKNILHKLYEYNIRYLPNRPYENIYGFDGWYGNKEPPSNDLNYMYEMTEGVSTHEWIRTRWVKEQLGSIPEKRNDTQIVVTHFDFTNHPMSADKNLLYDIYTKADILVVGHSHQKKHEFFNNMEIINPGSDYDKPNFVIVEV